jgi:hypothetical protein
MLSGILLLNEKDVAQALKVSLPNLRRWQSTGRVSSVWDRRFAIGSAISRRSLNGVADESIVPPTIAA